MKFKSNYLHDKRVFSNYCLSTVLLIFVGQRKIAKKEFLFLTCHANLADKNLRLYVFAIKSNLWCGYVCIFFAVVIHKRKYIFGARKGYNVSFWNGPLIRALISNTSLKIKVKFTESLWNLHSCFVYVFPLLIL